MRHRLPDERLSITHKFKVGGHEGYLTVGLYKNGMPGELFITMAKEGSTVSGLMDSFACATSIALQHGVPLKLLCEKFAHTRFEPSGWSNNPDIGYAKSIMDYIFRWLQLRFLTGQQQALFDGLRPKYVGGIAPVTKAGASPYDEIEWELRLAEITDAQGGVIFEQKDVETPKDWSMTATNIVASKYLHGTMDTPERETGVRQLVSRVAETIRDWGIKGGYFKYGRRRLHLPRRARAPAAAAEGRLQLAGVVQRGLRPHRARLPGAELALERRGAEGRIQPGRLHQAAVLRLLHQLGHDLEIILTLAKTEGMLFKWQRHGHEPVAHAPRGSRCRAAEPLPGRSVHEGLRRLAGAIKSGGKTAAPPKWSSSMLITPILRTSSRVRRKKKPRPGRWSSRI